MMEKIKSFLLRILATFVATALGLVGAGAIAGVDTIKSAIVAGIAGVATVLEELARTYMQKGKLTDRDIERAFDKVDEEN
jgi:hypothetical protein